MFYKYPGDQLATLPWTMTPFETQFLQALGIAGLRSVETLSISVFFYGSSPLLS